MILEKYSMGIGDRFGKQGEAQLKAIQMAGENGVELIPVWNKSSREHQIIGTSPSHVRIEADQAVQNLGWRKPYYVDADHVTLNTVVDFIQTCDFFTLDVADVVGEAAALSDIEEFVEKHRVLTHQIMIDGIIEPIRLSAEFLYETAEKYLLAIQEAERIYRRIKHGKSGEFIIEISMDETDLAQTPEELLIILAAIQDRSIPAQTIAPKFSGRFNKGVDYMGNVSQFTGEFESDLAVIRYAVHQFGLPDNLKLSIHSGSDKFMLYPIIRNAMSKFDAGIHLKTAGTTWLEELIGLALSSGEGLVLAKQIYINAYHRFEELCAPYAAVIDIDHNQLPAPEMVKQWSGSDYAAALKHDQQNPKYNMHFRQLLHVAYKIAAEMGQDFLNVLDKYSVSIGRHVSDNLFDRHIKPIFLFS